MSQQVRLSFALRALKAHAGHRCTLLLHTTSARRPRNRSGCRRSAPGACSSRPSQSWRPSEGIWARRIDVSRIARIHTLCHRFDFAASGRHFLSAHLGLTEARLLGMALPALSHEDWSFVAEGGANIVLSYRGRDPALAGKCLRLRKRRPFDDQAAGGTSEDPSLSYRACVVEPLLGSQHLPQTEPVRLAPSFVKAVQERIAPLRSETRRLEGDLDASQSGALLVEDLVAGGADVLTFEIKVRRPCAYEQASRQYRVRSQNGRTCHLPSQMLVWTAIAGLAWPKGFSADSSSNHASARSSSLAATRTKSCTLFGRSSPFGGALLALATTFASSREVCSSTAHTIPNLCVKAFSCRAALTCAAGLRGGSGGSGPDVGTLACTAKDR